MHGSPTRVLVATLAVLAAACTPDADDTPTPLADTLEPPTKTWVGEGSQWNDGDRTGAPDDTWDLRISLGADPTSGGSVEYPDLGCGGSLDYVSRDTGVEAEPGDLVFRERLSHGIENCFDGGTVVLRPTDGTMMYTWSLDGDPGQATARLKPE